MLIALSMDDFPVPLTPKITALLPLSSNFADSIALKFSYSIFSKRMIHLPMSHLIFQFFQFLHSQALCKLHSAFNQRIIFFLEVIEFNTYILFPFFSLIHMINYSFNFRRSAFSFFVQNFHHFSGSLICVPSAF